MRRTLSRLPTARRGFTLVELLVAAALSVIIMYVLATAFKTALDTLSGLKSVGTLADQVRTAETILAADLGATHLEDEDGLPVAVTTATTLDASGKPVEWRGDGGTAASKATPKRGYFKIVQSPRPQSGDPGFEGQDPEGTALPNIVRVSGDWVGFTCRLPGRNTSDVFAADVRDTLTGTWANRLTALQTQTLKDLGPAANDTTTFYSRWAEVLYFLQPTSVQTSDGDAGLPTIPLNTLYRQVKVIAPYQQADTTPTSGLDLQSTELVLDHFNDLSVYATTGSPPKGRINSPESVTDPDHRTKDSVYSTNRLNPPAATTGARQGTDILLSNVISMQVDVLTGTGTTFGSLPGVSNTETAAYDTALKTVDLKSGAAAPPDNRPQLRAVQIKLRVYDTKNRITRQVSIVQQL